MTGVMEDSVIFGELATAGGRRFGRATLNGPATLNALTLEMIDRMAPQFEAWAEDPSVVGIVLDGAGEKAFCAGGDVAALYRAIRAEKPGDVPALAEAFFEREYRLDYRIHTFAKPVLCWGHGIVMGGGIGLLAGASHRVVTHRSRLAMPEIGIGLYPDVGGSWFLNRMPGKLGEFLALTGAPLNAADARFAGLADFTVQHDDKARVLEAIAGTDWSSDADANAAQLSRLLAGFESPMAPEASPLRRHFDLIDQAIGHDTLAETAARLQALANHTDPWLAAAANSIAKGSPTSLVLAHEVLRLTRDMSLAEVFRLEYQLSVGCCTQHDLAEGVRALLIDKDRTPKWQPATLQAVTPASIAEHFKARYTGAHPLADLG